MSVVKGLKRWRSVLVVVWLIFASLGLRAQTTVFFEGFEGAFPGPWQVGDFEPAGDPGWWADVTAMGSVTPRTGSWMGYCAGVGNAGTFFAPRYPGEMYGFMDRTVNLAGQANPVLTFWVNIPSIEDGIDAFEVWINNVSLVYSLSRATIGWEQVTLDLSAWAGTTTLIGFWFYSDDSIEFEGAYLDDIQLSVAGTPRPNLTPYQRPGYSDKLVLSKVTGTTTDDTNFSPSDPVYVDWAVVNNGQAAVGSSFTVQVLVNDVVRNTWNANPGLPVNSFILADDYNVGPLAAGVHTIKVRADAANAVTESNESDNEYSRTITVSGNPEIRIDPLSLGFSVTNSGAGGGESGLSASANGTEEIAVASTEEKLTQAHEVLEQMDAGAEEVHVIVNLVSPGGRPRNRGEWESRPRLRGWQQLVKERQDEVLAALAPEDFKLRHLFENQSGFSGRVTRKGLAALARHPRVASIQYSRPVTPHLAQGIPLMNGSLYRSSYNGSGVAIAIVDTGVDYNHPRLGGGGFPNSKVIGGYDFGDSDPDPNAAGNAHGTACAGIAAGNLGTVGDYIGGVAYNAKIYSLKISPGASQSASDADIIAAWNWCVSHKNDDANNPILVISTSFGGGRYFDYCDGSQTAYVIAAGNALSAGITVLASSGNSGYCDSIGSPACVSGVISVGAVFDAAYGNTTYCLTADSCAPKYSSTTTCPATGWATDDVAAPDKVTRYSNASSFMDILAPAHNANTTDIAGPSGYGGGDYAVFGGTSAACPYAAGAVAALQSAAKSITGRYLTPIQVRTLLADTGNLVTDPKATHIIKPRVNLGRAIETLGQNSSFTIFNDGNGPLIVTSIMPESSAPWIALSPPAPFSVQPGGAQVVGVSIDPAQAPAGVSTQRLLVDSNDGDESPYPGGVFINVTNIVSRPQLSAILTNNRVVICWPTQNASGYVLQWVHALPSTNWSNVPAISIVVGTNRYVTNTIIPNGKKFYRLRGN